jgi:hypothetical protein
MSSDLVRAGMTSEPLSLPTTCMFFVTSPLGQCHGISRSEAKLTWHYRTIALAKKIGIAAKPAFARRGVNTVHARRAASPR